MNRIVPVVLTLLLSACGSGSATLSRAQIEQAGEVWPFAIDTVKVGCEAGLPWVDAEGRRYALNGLARRRWPYADPVLASDAAAVKMLRAAGDTNPFEPRIPPDDVLKRAQAYC